VERDLGVFLDEGEDALEEGEDFGEAVLSGDLLESVYEVEELELGEDEDDELEDDPEDDDSILPASGNGTGEGGRAAATDEAG
jgi:hypothetical protein